MRRPDGLSSPFSVLLLRIFSSGASDLLLQASLRARAGWIRNGCVLYMHRSSASFLFLFGLPYVPLAHASTVKQKKHMECMEARFLSFSFCNLYGLDRNEQTSMVKKKHANGDPCCYLSTWREMRSSGLSPLHVGKGRIHLLRKDGRWDAISRGLLTCISLLTTASTDYYSS